MELTGSQILMKVFEEEGVDTVFGYPGGAVIDIYDALDQTDINHIFVRHEQGAVHAADGYARAGDRVGVCIATSGPGATNTVTGIASAYLDSIPMVVITGQVPTSLIGNDAFQEVDIVGITRPCTKHNYLVTDVKKLAKTLREAFYIARSGRPGPVLVDIPKDISQTLTEYTPPTGEAIQMKTYKPNTNPSTKQLEKVFKLLKQAKKPMIFTGGGTILSGASEELTAFAKKMNIPVTGSLMGLGSFPGTDPLWLGMLGMHGTYRANMATSNCDLMIAVGVRFDDRVTGKTDEFANQAKIIQIDIDPTSIQKNIAVDVPIVGDCKKALKKLNELLQSEKIEEMSFGRDEWLAEIKHWKDTTPLAYAQDDKIKPQYVIEKFFEMTNGEAIITTEVGQNQMWAAQYYNFKKPNHFITSGGLGCMGFGLPAAVGAQMACPDKIVADIAGDGSIQMNIQEMATAVQYGLPVKIIILNNRYLGMVRQWQELFYDKRYASTTLDHNPDFVKLAEAYGAVGLRATKPSEVEDVLRKGLETPKTVIMEFVVDREENVYPMVPAGKAITEMLLV